jgi:hypothetical protein
MQGPGKPVGAVRVDTEASEWFQITVRNQTRMQSVSIFI